MKYFWYLFILFYVYAAEKSESISEKHLELELSEKFFGLKLNLSVKSSENSNLLSLIIKSGLSNSEIKCEKEKKVDENNLSTESNSLGSIKEDSQTKLLKFDSPKPSPIDKTESHSELLTPIFNEIKSSESIPVIHESLDPSNNTSFTFVPMSLSSSQKNETNSLDQSFNNETKIEELQTSTITSDFGINETETPFTRVYEETNSDENNESGISEINEITEKLELTTINLPDIENISSLSLTTENNHESIENKISNESLVGTKSSIVTSEIPLTSTSSESIFSTTTSIVTPSTPISATTSTLTTITTTTPATEATTTATISSTSTSEAERLISKRTISTTTESPCNRNFQFHENSCIFVSNEKLTWEKANRKCKRFNSSLIWFDSRDEIENFLNFVNFNFLNFEKIDDNLWIGASFDSREEQWKFRDVIDEDFIFENYQDFLCDDSSQLEISNGYYLALTSNDSDGESSNSFCLKNFDDEEEFGFVCKANANF
ncbi:unnamed protein product [Brachionus calyciflorus]|uniref:C-type lectin domain-containing protein n=1 Tax=Brachionus calyciflorus TaxID=104777 RepID=A0A813WRE9_9BILA|nr:unnamed protein product [Brachionus calyciflorus]